MATRPRPDAALGAACSRPTCERLFMQPRAADHRLEDRPARDPATCSHGAKPLLGQLGPFLEQLNPILNWLSLHQQLISDFISNGAAGHRRHDDHLRRGNGIGHYLRQFSPIGPETLSFCANRDADNRGNTYPPPLWLADPKRASEGHAAGLGLQEHRRGRQTARSRPPTSRLVGHPACWVAPPLPGAIGEYTIPHIKPAHVLEQVGTGGRDAGGATPRGVGAARARRRSARGRSSSRSASVRVARDLQCAHAAVGLGRERADPGRGVAADRASGTLLARSTIVTRSPSNENR